MFLLLRRAIKEERPNVLQFATGEGAWIAWYTARMARLPHIIYAHGNEILVLSRTRWHKPKDAFQNAAMVIANSRFTAGMVKQKLGLPVERIRIVHPGCDTQRFHPTPVPDGFRARLTGKTNAYPLLLSVGNLVERKGHDLVIRALPELKHLFPQISYAIVGEGRDRKVLERLCKSLGVTDTVRFAGRGVDSELPVYYSACDIFVMPSRARFDKDDVEGFGMVFLEAAACGKAVIGGRSGGIEDAIDEGNTGLLIDPESIGELVAAVAQLAHSPDTRARFGRAGQNRVNRDFTWSINGSKIEHILGEVLSR